MKKAILVAIIGAFAVSVNAGDWGGKAVAPKAPIAGCPDTSGYVTVGYGTDYIYKGYRLYTDAVNLGVGYTFESVVPVTLSVNHISETRAFQSSGAGTGGIASAIGETSITELGLSAQVASVAGLDVSLGYVQRFYHGVPTAFGGGVNSSGELGLGIAKDLGFARAHFDLFYNINAPNSYNTGNLDRGAWFWDLGLDKEIGLTENVSLVIGAGVTYADNYWGNGPALGGNTPHSSGWNNYYARVSLPIQLNCAATLTPYIGYNGAPEGWLMDGAPGGDSNFFLPQSDILSAGISLTVKF